MLEKIECWVPRRFRGIARDCIALQPRYRSRADTDLTARYRRLRELAHHQPPTHTLRRYLVAHTFAVGREAIRRTLGTEHRPVQLLGAAAVAYGHLAEIATGEGKTITLFLAAAAHALRGNGVHVITANSYLAARDAAALEPAYRLLGLTVAPVPAETHRKARRCAYAADITYGTLADFGFDHLRDALVTNPADRVHRGHHVAILDEADAVLIDEANTSLILTTSTDAPADRWPSELAAVVPRLTPVLDYHGLLSEGQVGYTDRGWSRLHQFSAVDPEAWRSAEFLAAAQNALAAHLLYEMGRDYIVEDEQVLLVDVHTGRSLPGRRLATGLHQALEAKEKLPVCADPVPRASISVQAFLRQYRLLGGVSGTVMSEAAELRRVYRVPVTHIPPHRPSRRVDLPDQLYPTSAARDEALVDEVLAAHRQRRPVLVSTPSCVAARNLFGHLTAAGLRPRLLTAEDDQAEAQVISQAGRIDAVTVATGLAGRGTDIRLGGPDTAEARRIRRLGGLLVLAAGRSTSPRADRQLAGRAGRQGDPGTTRFLLSAEDDLLLDNASTELRRVLDTHPGHAETPLIGRPVDRLVRRAQVTADWRRFLARRQLQRYDEVIDHQWQAVARSRSHILTGDLHDTLPTLATAVRGWAPGQLRAVGGRTWPASAFCGPDGAEAATRGRIGDALVQHGQQEIRQLLLAVVDQAWTDHIHTLLVHQDASHAAVWLHSDPVEEFRRVAISSYQNMITSARRELLRTLLQDPSPPVLPLRHRDRRWEGTAQDEPPKDSTSHRPTW
ncbi:preprotein translocase subunit SecA [Crossiella cryophila]|uniref:Protein translocase subunit SecA n=1 Tax=Crossiella cryophila TaxID=43355 RepID=A0A7W7FWT5_9PSEU|nr:hypothetical protein [Crossiella cryophila]MBB4681846.1 preprotein translocase subunit SecA [Crossiella cryophila]